MSTPEENFEAASAGSTGDEERERAIDDLGTANECDKLADLARMDDLDEQYREQAVATLATPQCTETLRTLAEGDDLPGSLRERAESLLEETPDDSGAGP